MVQSARHGVTHLVARTIARTVKFLSALNVVKHIVTAEWIEQSALENKFLGKLENSEKHSCLHESCSWAKIFCD